MNSHVTRVVVVTPEGTNEYFADHWTVSRQDQGQTLKLFATGDGKQGRQARSTALKDDLRKMWLDDSC